MKKTIKLLLALAFVMVSTGAFAQKFARIDYQRVIETMPEMDSVDLKYQKAAQDYQDLLVNRYLQTFSTNSQLFALHHQHHSLIRKLGYSDDVRYKQLHIRADSICLKPEAQGQRILRRYDL